MTYRSINSTTRTISDLLDSHFRSDALLRPFFEGGAMIVSPRTPQEMEEADATGLSVWLYRIARDPELLNLPPRRIGPNTLEYRPLPLRLHYLMTPIVNEHDELGNDPGLEQFLIGKVLQTLHDHSKIHGAMLRGDLVGTGTTLTVRMEPLGLEEITRVWDAMESSYQLCVSYEVSLVLVASDQEVEHVSPVESVEPEYGVITGVES